MAPLESTATGPFPLACPTAEQNLNRTRSTCGMPYAFFSTDGNRYAPRQLEEPKPAAIARSDPWRDATETIQKLRERFPQVCRGIFSHSADGHKTWDITWFFDEYDFHVQGGEFLYNVIFRMMKQNEDSLYSFVRRWSEQHRAMYPWLPNLFLGIEHMFAEEDRKIYGDEFCRQALRHIRRAYELAIATEPAAVLPASPLEVRNQQRDTRKGTLDIQTKVNGDEMSAVMNGIRGGEKKSQNERPTQPEVPPKPRRKTVHYGQTPPHVSPEQLTSLGFAGQLPLGAIQIDPYTGRPMRSAQYLLTGGQSKLSQVIQLSSQSLPSSQFHHPLTGDVVPAHLGRFMLEQRNAVLPQKERSPSLEPQQPAATQSRPLNSRPNGQGNRWQDQKWTEENTASIGQRDYNTNRSKRGSGRSRGRGGFSEGSERRFSASNGGSGRNYHPQARLRAEDIPWGGENPQLLGHDVAQFRGKQGGHQGPTTSKYLDKSTLPLEAKNNKTAMHTKKHSTFEEDISGSQGKTISSVITGLPANKSLPLHNCERVPNQMKWMNSSNLEDEVPSEEERVGPKFIGKDVHHIRVLFVGGWQQDVFSLEDIAETFAEFAQVDHVAKHNTSMAAFVRFYNEDDVRNILNRKEILCKGHPLTVEVPKRFHHPRPTESRNWNQWTSNISHVQNRLKPGERANEVPQQIKSAGQISVTGGNVDTDRNVLHRKATKDGKHPMYTPQDARSSLERENVQTTPTPQKPTPPQTTWADVAAGKAKPSQKEHFEKDGSLSASERADTKVSPASQPTLVESGARDDSGSAKRSKSPQLGPSTASIAIDHPHSGTIIPFSEDKRSEHDNTSATNATIQSPAARKSVSSEALQSPFWDEGVKSSAQANPGKHIEYERRPGAKRAVAIDHLGWEQEANSTVGPGERPFPDRTGYNRRPASSLNCHGETGGEKHGSNRAAVRNEHRVPREEMKDGESVAQGHSNVQTEPLTVEIADTDDDRDDAEDLQEAKDIAVELGHALDKIEREASTTSVLNDAAPQPFQNVEDDEPSNSSLCVPQTTSPALSIPEELTSWAKDYDEIQKAILRLLEPDRKRMSEAAKKLEKQLKDLERRFAVTLGKYETGTKTMKKTAKKHLSAIASFHTTKVEEMILLHGQVLRETDITKMNSYPALNKSTAQEELYPRQKKIYRFCIAPGPESVLDPETANATTMPTIDTMMDLGSPSAIQGSSFHMKRRRSSGHGDGFGGEEHSTYNGTEAADDDIPYRPLPPIPTSSPGSSTLSGAEGSPPPAERKGLEEPAGLGIITLEEPTAASSSASSTPKTVHASTGATSPAPVATPEPVHTTPKPLSWAKIAAGGGSSSTGTQKHTITDLRATAQPVSSSRYAESAATLSPTPSSVSASRRVSNPARPPVALPASLFGRSPNSASDSGARRGSSTPVRAANELLGPPRLALSRGRGAEGGGGGRSASAVRTGARGGRGRDRAAREDDKGAGAKEDDEDEWRVGPEGVWGLEGLPRKGG